MQGKSELTDGSNNCDCDLLIGFSTIAGSSGFGSDCVASYREEAHVSSGVYLVERGPDSILC